MNKVPAYCPVCSLTDVESWNTAKDYEYHSVDDTFCYFHCRDCKTIFIDPVPVDKLHIIYPANYYSFSGHSKNIVVRLKEWLDKRFFKRILKRVHAQEINILDVGGGTGWIPGLLRSIDQRVAHTQIVDIDSAAKVIAGQNGHAYFEGTIEQFSSDEKFHLVLLLNLIEHVADPLAVLKKAETLLAPGGLVIIKTPNTASLDAKLFRKSYWGGLHCPRHWTIFSEKSFRHLLTSTGLEVEKLAYTQGAPFWAFSIIAALHRKKIITISQRKPIIFHWLFAPVSAVFAVFDFVRRPFAKTSQMFITLKKKA